MMRAALVLVAFTATFTLCVPTGTSVVAAANGSALEVVELQDNPIEMSDESIRAGRQVYGRFCRSCHGLRADGAGMTAPPGSMPANLVDDEWDHGSTDAEIFTVIKEGVAPKFDMDAWDGRVSDDDIWHVINFLRDLASE
ncbi:MAG: c-type cytochrome [Vicinamibacterales bacterium]|jgi:mono/diheme cytochrome c family protein|nr:c-type cytochrome [Vicinamibacterales bacterium]